MYNDGVRSMPWSYHDAVSFRRLQVLLQATMSGAGLKGKRNMIIVGVSRVRQWQQFLDLGKTIYSSVKEGRRLAESFGFCSLKYKMS